MVQSSVIVVALAAIVVTGHPVRHGPVSCAAPPLDQREGASRASFMREVLFAAPTPRTPMFADFPGSYHLDKRDLAAGIQAEATRCGVRLRALVIVGPVGPLWTYHTVAFVEAGDTVRLSTLVMPHARITGKAEALLARAALDSFALALTTSPALRRGLPTSTDSVSTGADGDFAFDFLFTRYEVDGAVHWHGTLFPRGGEGPSADALAVLEALNGMLKRTRATYPPPSTR